MERISNLTVQQLRTAADLKEQIDALQEKLSGLLGGAAPALVAVARDGRRGRKKISAEGIARIRAAQKARWAAVKTARPAPKRKRKFSAAGRARLAALAKARWAKVKAAGKTRLS